MDSNIIKFRLSPEDLEMLESVRSDNESFHQVAKRILKTALKYGTQLGHDTGHSNQDNGTHQQDTGHSNQDNGTHQQDTVHNDFDPDIFKEQLKAELREELVSEINEVVKANLDNAKAELLGE